MDSLFLRIWIGTTVVMFVGMIAFLIWAVTSRQFSEQDRARYLPLDKQPDRSQKAGQDDKGHRTANGEDRS